MSIRKFILLLSSVFMMASCSDRGSGSKTAIPFVEKILNDSTSAIYAMPEGRPDIYGTIAVIGEPADVILMTEELISADRRDNISGKSFRDSLPDFAGEVIQPIMDIANSPYENYITLNNEGFLRELNVRNFLFALDTCSLQSPFDTTNFVRKQRAKAVIFASTLSSAYGFFDADTLSKAAHTGVKVFSPVHSMVRYACSRHEGPQNLAVWSTKSRMGNGAYASIIGSEFAAAGDKNSVYEVFCPVADSLREEGSLKGQFLNFLDMYMVGSKQKLSSMLLDDPSVKPSELIAVIDEIKNTDDDVLLAYRNLLADDFECIYPSKALAEECYDYLRNGNLFTHRVAYPAMKGYVTAPVTTLSDECYDVDGSLSYAYKYSRGVNAAWPTYSLVELRPRYLAAVYAEFMEENAPVTYSLYVR